VGVVLTIFWTVRAGDAVATRCNPCAWYVDPPFRAYAGMLFAKSLVFKNVTYLNVSPAPHTWRMMEALGFTRYSDGIFVALPMLQRPLPSPMAGETGVKVFGADRRPSVDFEPFELELLQRHVEQGCIGLWCATSERAYPFVFSRKLVRGFIPCAQLIYCRGVEDFVRFAGPIGRFLARRGGLLVIIDANGPIPGLIGSFRRGSAPKYFKGPERPRLGDLAYTEFGVLGV
jgi:hypothetical protein